MEMEMEMTRRTDPHMWEQLYRQASDERADALERARDAERELRTLERDYRRMRRRLTLAVAAALALGNAAFWLSLLG